jgi:uncharacterized membrane protein
MTANVALRRLVDARVALPLPARLLLAALGLMNLGVLAPLPALPAAVTLPLALLVPGYAVIMAVFSNRPRRDAPATLACTVLLSMATYPLVALALYAVAIPIRTGSVMVSIDGIVALLVAVAVLRMRHRAPVSSLPVAPLAAATVLRSAWNGARGGALFAALVAIVIAVLAGAMALVRAPTDQAYTQFYLAGSWAHLNTIVRARSHQKLVVDVGIVNQTHRRQSYQIVPRLDGGPDWPGRVVTVPDARSWTGSLSGDVPQDGCVHRLGIVLRMGRNGNALSPLTLWVRGAPGPSRPCTTTSRTRGKP